MTKEEAKRIAQGLITDFKCESETMVDFCNMVIKALEQEPCDDSISRQAVIEWLKDKDIIKTKNQEENARRELAELPSVEPERKNGKWIDKGIIGNTEAHNFVCSECGWNEPDFPERIGELHYCTSCGAKMEVEN